EVGHVALRGEVALLLQAGEIAHGPSGAKVTQLPIQRRIVAQAPDGIPAGTSGNRHVRAGLGVPFGDIGTVGTNLELAHRGLGQYIPHLEVDTLDFLPTNVGKAMVQINDLTGGIARELRAVLGLTLIAIL